MFWGMEQAVAMEEEFLVVALDEVYILDEVDAMHGLRALGAAAAPEVVVEMEVSLMVPHLGHGLVKTLLERLSGAEVLEVRISQDLFLGKFLLYH